MSEFYVDIAGVFPINVSLRRPWRKIKNRSSRGGL
jgi:hypothetical protein